MKKFFVLAVTVLSMMVIGCAAQGKAGSPLTEEKDLPFVLPALAPISFDNVSASELVEQITIGWNLGNTMDTTDLHWLTNPSTSQMETAWGNPVTKKENIDTIKETGFNTIRIPVSWAKCADASNDYKIRDDWMARVKQIVDYSIDNDMIIILNTHHDEGIFKFRNSEMEESKKAFGKIWEQIAETFKDYDERLIFEDLNEPRTKGSPMEWNGGTIEERNNLNLLHQLFVDIVRASGGNNAQRVLLISTYAASSTEMAMSGLVLPTDTVANKLAVSIHAYEPYNFALNKDSAVNIWTNASFSDTMPIIERVDRAYNLFVSKGIPVIMGEFGALNKNNEISRAAWAEYYVGYAKRKGVRCVWWDDGGDFKLLNRSNNTFYYPQIKDGLLRGAFN